MPNKKNNEYNCIQEARISTIETKLSNKKEHLHEVDEDYYHLRDKLEAININVAELTAIMKANQNKEIENDKKIDGLTKELANLKADVMSLDTKVEKTNSSLDTMKWLLPIGFTILSFIVNYLISPKS